MSGVVDTAEDAFDHAPCGLLTLAPDGVIAAVNDTFLQWTGHARAELVGSRRLDELFPMAGRIYHDTHLWPLLRMQGFAYEIAADIVCAGGRVLPTFLNAVEERDAQGKVKRVRVAVFEGTDRRTYERELLLAKRTSEQAAKAKADFLAMFAHEIRNPLGAVLLQLEVLQRKGLVAQEEARLGRLRASLDRVLALINDMLDFSKLDAGKVVLEETSFDLHDVLSTVVHTLAPLAERKELPLELDVDARLPPRLRGDPVKLGQVLTNLVANAIKFTEKGRVAIGVAALGRELHSVHLRLWVEDTGIGIAPERQQAIFDEYAQADPSVTRRFGGTGLGLSIARRLVELQGGELKVRSTPGVGSTFWFELRLPVDEERASAPL